MKPLLLLTDQHHSTLHYMHDHWQQALTLDFRTLEQELRLYGSMKILQECKKIINELANEPYITFMGSGDFHHLTYPLLTRLTEPFILVILDNHTDCSFIPPQFSCGNWVNMAAKISLCEKIIHIGATQGYGPVEKRLGVTQLIAQKKMLSVPGGELMQQGIAVVENALALCNNDLPFYLSIDKDVLNVDVIKTDWDQGVISLEEMYSVIQLLKSRRCVGVDICGEKTEQTIFKNRLKQFISRFDHPKLSRINESEFQKNILKHYEINQSIYNLIEGDCGYSSSYRNYKDR
ncbi:arginase family protein [Legionella cherrii]|uniref:Arginase family n=1 Tax=Legionella cherrii TaxID=28084 RepID=A0A0W0S8Z2_9GAMM|nr:arginase family protein [Legionella cherrii]KTC79810.1 Arginase family protein [Legionella cherrii]VEB38028.1 Arginase family [Legionella cherrii]